MVGLWHLLAVRLKHYQVGNYNALFLHVSSYKMLILYCLTSLSMVSIAILKKDLLTLITYWQQQGRTVLTALHDPLVVREFFPQMIQINQQNAFMEKQHSFSTIPFTPLCPLSPLTLCVLVHESASFLLMTLSFLGYKTCMHFFLPLC